MMPHGNHNHNNNNNPYSYGNDDDLGKLPSDTHTIFVKHIPDLESREIRNKIDNILNFKGFNFRKKGNNCFYSFSNRWKMYNAIKILDNIDFEGNIITCSPAKRPIN